MNRIKKIVLLVVLGLGLPSMGWSQTCTNAPSGLVGWWPGDGNADNTAAIDIIGGSTGALNGGAAFSTSSKVGPAAFSFDGTNSALRINWINPSLNLTTFTVEAWVNPRSLSGNGGFIVSKHTTLSVNYELGFNLINKLEFGFFDGAWHFVTSTAVPQVGAWTHLVGTYDGSTIKLYVDGVLDVQLSYTGTPPTTGQPMSIGQRSNGTFTFDGLIDEVSIYNRALTDAEILGIFQAGSGGKCRPLDPACAALQAQLNTISAGLVQIETFLGKPIAGATTADRFTTLKDAILRLRRMCQRQLAGFLP